MADERPFFVAGEWRHGDRSVPVTSPADGSVVARVSQADSGATTAATVAAVEAFAAVGRRASARQRGEWLESLGECVARRREEIAATMTREMGKPIKFSRLEVDRCLFTLRDGAEEARRLGGEYVPLDVIAGTEGYWGVSRRVPVGPVLGIVPFNFPCNLLAHKLAPALASGCSIVIKPSPKAPLTPLLMAAAYEDSGAPGGLLSVLPCADDVAGEMVADDRFELLSFTGSPAVGWHLKSMAGKKRVHLELGNNSGVIVHDDCPDIDWAARRCALGAFAAGGQSCISVQRVFVQRRLHDDFVDRLAGAAASLVVGDPLDDATDIGPLVDEASAERVIRWIDEAADSGARVVCGGGRDGAVVQATILTDVPPDATIQRQEVFGPVLTVTPYDEFAAAVEAVNDTPLGLQAGVFTRDLGRIRYAWEELVVGGVCINDYPTFRVDSMPYGGVKDSGLGREGVRYALEEAYTEPRLLAVNGALTELG
jgi:glyceraldehyde-3-phosphate dehydrogenase (NADP+)